MASMTGVRQIELSYLRDAALKYVKPQIDAARDGAAQLGADRQARLVGDVGQAYLVGALECLRGHFNVHWSAEGHRSVYRGVLGDVALADAMYTQLTEVRDELDQAMVRAAHEEIAAALSQGREPGLLRNYLVTGLQRTSSIDVDD